MVSDVKSDDGDTSMYKAKAVDDTGNAYEIYWETTDEWEDALWTDWLSLNMILVRLATGKTL